MILCATTYLSVRRVSIIFFPHIIAEFLDLSPMPSSYPATATTATPRAAVASSNVDTLAASSLPTPDLDTNELDASSNDSGGNDKVADESLTDDQVRQLVQDPSTPPHDSGKVILQVDCVAFFKTINLIVRYNINPKKKKKNIRLISESNEPDFFYR